MTAAARLARFAAGLDEGDIPGDVAARAKLQVLDTLGCGLAAHALGIAGEGRAAVAESGGAAEAVVIGLPERLPAPSAALANGVLCHGLDFDDTHPRSICHVGTVVVPAAVAAAEAAGSGGGELLAGLVAGGEVIARIGAAAAPAYMTQGFHPTGVCGAFGAAAAAARLMHLDESATTAALGIAGSFAAGLFEYLGDGSATKPIHAGWAAHAGLLAARLAAQGGEGPATVLEGRFGLYATHFRLPEAGTELARELESLGSRWETLEVAYKPYPACHFVHSALDAAAEACFEEALAPEDIEEVVARVPEAAVPLVLEPTGAKTEPRTAYDAKFSLQYSLAALLVHGRVDVGTYTDEAISDSAVRAVARRVRYEVGDFEGRADAFPASVRITTRDGRTLEAMVLEARGSRANPFSDDEVLAKFRANALLALDEEGVEQLERMVLALEGAADVRDALAPLAAAGAAAAAR